MLGGIPSRSLALFSLALILASIAVLPDRAAAASGWQVVLDRPTPNFGPVDFVSDNEGWMPAGAGLLHTTDGGATWTENAKLTVNDVDFFDQQHGWAVGPEAAIFHTTNGGETWEQQESGLYASMYFTDIEAISTSEAWAVALENTSDVPTFPDSAILHTTDRGENWIRVETSVPGAFDEVEFAGSTGWLLGAVCRPDCVILDIEPGMLRTSDGGATWSEVSGIPRGASQLQFVDGLHGWYVSSNCNPGPDCATGVYTSFIHRTDDGGVTWSAVDVTDLGARPSVAFADTLRGWGVSVICNEPYALVCEQRVIETDDGGITWRTSATIPTPPGYRGLLAAQYGSLYLAGPGIAQRSLDEGQSWTDMEHPALKIEDMDFVDHNAGFALDGSNVVTTNDGGRSWDRRGTIPHGSFLQVRGLSFFDSSTGVAAIEGCDATCRIEILHSSDGGDVWTTAATFPYESGFEFKTLQIGNDGSAVAAAYRGLAITTDHGTTWNVLDVPGEQDHVLNGAAILDAAHLWADSYPEAGGPSVLYFSSDGGETWQQTYQGLPLGDVQFFDAQHGWARALEDYFRTSDGGRTWTQIPMPVTSRLYEAAFIDPLNGWASIVSGEAGAPGSYRIVQTSDGGETWTDDPAQIPDHQVPNQLEFVDAETGWFTITPSCAFGVGCGDLPTRTVLYHMSNGHAGGPTDEPPVKLPIVGTGADHDSSMPLILILAAAGLTTLTASFALRRRSGSDS